jgi:4-hydroxy-tetrahydrodipicolinate synthase
MVTPLLDRDTLDVAGLERLTEHILGDGVQGLFILGTTGEAPSLSYHLRYELIEHLCGLVKGRVPVLVGITDTSFTESVNTAVKARDALEYLKHLTPELPLPLFLYNMPSYTKAVFEPQTVRAAAEINGIAGLKDSSGDMVYFRKLQLLLKDRPDFSLLIGHEELLAEAISSGGHGGVCGGGNFVPRLYVDLYNAARSRDLPAVEILHKKVMQISTTIYRVGHFESSYLKGLKCTLSCMGICSDFLAEPFHRFRCAERDVIRRHLEELGIVQKE